MCFHLGWPDISARYNAVGRFGRISEVATRIAGQLSGEGNSAAFREFAWRFVNIIARALVELGQTPGLPADPAPRRQHRCAVHRVRAALFRQGRTESLGDHRPARRQAERQEHSPPHDRPREARGGASSSICRRCASTTRCSTACARRCVTTGPTSTRSSRRCCRCWRS